MGREDMRTEKIRKGVGPRRGRLISFGLVRSCLKAFGSAPGAGSISRLLIVFIILVGSLRCASAQERITSPHFVINAPDALKGSPVPGYARRALEDARAAMISNHFRVPEGIVEVSLDIQGQGGLRIPLSGAESEEDVRITCTESYFAYSLGRCYFPEDDISGPVVRESSAWFLDSITLYACARLLRRPDMAARAVEEAPRFLERSLDRAQLPESRAWAAFWIFLEGKHRGLPARVLEKCALGLANTLHCLEGELRDLGTSLPIEYAEFARKYVPLLASLASNRIGLSLEGPRKGSVTLAAGRLSTFALPLEVLCPKDHLPGTSLVVTVLFPRKSPQGPSVELLVNGSSGGTVNPGRPVLRLPCGPEDLTLLVCNPSDDDWPDLTVQAYLLVPPSSPAVLTSTRDLMVLTWQVSDPDGSTLFRYRIYRRLPGEGKPRLVGVAREGVNIWEERDYRPDRKVTYTVRALDSFGHESGDSEEMTAGGPVPVFQGKLESLIPSSFPAGWRREAPEELRFEGGSRVRGLSISVHRTVLSKGRAFKGTITIVLEQYPSQEEARSAYEEGLHQALERWDRLVNLRREMSTGALGDASAVVRYERDDLSSPLLTPEAERWYIHYERVLKAEVVGSVCYEGPAAVGEYRDLVRRVIRDIVEKVGPDPRAREVRGFPIPLSYP